MNPPNPPLYKEMREAPPVFDNRHHGLWYDRFFNQYDEQWQVYVEDKHRGTTDGKRAWISTVEKDVGEKEALQKATDRLAMLCHFRKGDIHIATGSWHFATGLGNPHPVENGFLWHPTLGVPYIPGAAVKGLLRAWLEGEWKERRDNHKLHRWFGSEDKDPKKCDNDNKAGAFIFFDALPLEPVTLKADIMTPHMDEWYEKGGENPLDQKVTPADWHSPVPIPFLVADKPKFMFPVAPRNGKECAEELLKVMKALKSALEWLGAGAKTAVGYGHMPDEDKNERRKILERVERASMSDDEWVADEVKKLNPEELAKMLGKNRAKTKKKQGDLWPVYLEQVIKVYGELIHSWEHSSIQNEKMAYKFIFKHKEIDQS